MFRNSKKGFSLLELIVVLLAIGILGTLGYKKYADITESTRAASLKDYLVKAEVAYSKVIALQGKIRPTNLNATGDAYESPETLRCFNFEPTSSAYTGVSSTASGSAFDPDATIFKDALRQELIEIGFKEKSGGGLYIPGAPRTAFSVCSKYGARFFAIENTKGSIANKILKIVNNGMKSSEEDGRAIDRRIAIWNKTASGVYSHMDPSLISATATTPTTPSASTTDGGDTTPAVNEKKIEENPAVTVTYAITQGTGTATSW